MTVVEATTPVDVVVLALALGAELLEPAAALDPAEL